MNTHPSVSELELSIREIYASDPERARDAIMEYLESCLGEVSLQGRIEALRSVQARLKEHEKKQVGGDEVMADFVRLLLGSKASHAAPSSPETVQRLVASLNTVFDSLNELISVMNATLGSAGRGEETIRAVIGSDLDSARTGQTLEEYLGQIRRAFLVSHKAFQDAARTIVGNILAQTDPGKIQSSLGSGLKIGPLKKADAFDAFEAAYGKVKRWFESPRFAEDLLREFERSCQRSFSHREGKF
ncbi:MAG TPA: hypothetical protein PLA83_01560 [Deltaproteobacteria bacterium]|jgi:prophage DNA circulation protein|nr:hypothetical protein [Deltaproteobacteria bacterium]HQI00653.1 hypothetical protein [Deltaproteobacteria bacterium]